MNFKKILVIQTSFLGDTILTLPLIRSIKKNFPDTQVWILTTPQNSDVFSDNKDISEIITYDKHGEEDGVSGFIRKLKQIKQEHFDVLISAHRSMRTSLLVLFSHIPLRIGFSDSAMHFVYNRVVKRNIHVHEVERDLSLLTPLNIGKEKWNYEANLYYSEQAKAFCDNIFEAYGIRDELKIGINPFSIWHTKRWPKERFKILAEKILNELNGRVFIFGLEKDEEEADFIADGNKHIINIAGKTNLKELFCVISKMNMFITNDSGPMHIACAYNIPTVAIFGPTVPEFGFSPWGKNCMVIERKGLKCRPCGKHGSFRCREKHFKCMLDISVDEVFVAVKRLLDENLSHSV
jgi:heptosyltransferase-2